MDFSDLDGLNDSSFALLALVAFLFLFFIFAAPDFVISLGIASSLQSEIFSVFTTTDSKSILEAVICACNEKIKCNS